MREADELSECRIKNSQRVRKINALVDVEFVASSKSESGAGKIEFFQREGPKPKQYAEIASYLRSKEGAEWP